MSTASSTPNPYGWVRHLMPRVVIGALIAAALVGVYAVILGRFDETCWRLIGTVALFVAFALISWYDAEVSARRAVWFGAVSAVTSFYLFGIGLWKIWAPVPAGDGSAPWWDPFSWFLLVAVTRLGLLHIHLVLNTQRRFTGPVMSKVTVTTLVLVGLLTAGLSVPLIWTSADLGDTYWRLVAVVAILDALGTVLIPLTYSLFGPKQPKPAFVPGVTAFAPAPVPAATPAGAPTAGPTVAPPAGAAPFAPPVAPYASAAPAAPVPAPAPATPASAYPRLDAAEGLRLEWPRYINGQPLPAAPDGTPDFTGVVGY